MWIHQEPKNQLSEINLRIHIYVQNIIKNLINYCSQTVMIHSEMFLTDSSLLDIRPLGDGAVSDIVEMLGIKVLQK